MRLLGKPAGAVLWETVGPQENRNHFFPAVAPELELWFTADAGTTFQVYKNQVPLVKTGHGSYPVNIAEGIQPDPSKWVVNGAVIVAGTDPSPTVRGSLLATVPTDPVWIRVVLVVPGDGHVKMVTKWQ